MALNWPSFRSTVIYFYLLQCKDNCRTLVFLAPFTNKRLVNHNIKNKTRVDFETCQLHCYNEPNCVSINYEVQTQTCELNNATHRRHGNDFINKNGYLYHGADSFCDETSCHNGGICQSGYTVERYRCLCPSGFGGKRCQKEFNATFTCDNSMELFADDKSLGQDNGKWEFPFIYHVPGETRVISVKGTDMADGGRYYGILGSTSNGLVTSETWKCSSVFQRGWTSPDFDDQGWNFARVVGDHGDGPWYTIDGIAKTAKWIWANDDNKIVYCRLKLQ